MNHDLGQVYRRLLVRRGHATAKVAVARRLLVRASIISTDVASQLGLCPRLWFLQRGC
jgi:hypothetical protein